MQFNEIRKELEGAVFDTIRTDSADYFEAVIVNNASANLTAKLDKIFGSPVRLSGSRSPLEVQEKIKDLGGIRPARPSISLAMGRML